MLVCTLCCEAYELQIYKRTITTLFISLFNTYNILYVAVFYGHHQVKVYQIKKYSEDRTNATIIFSDKI